MENAKHSAFTMQAFNSEGRLTEYEHGLTKREYFAARAMQGILSNSAFANMEVFPRKQLNDDIIAEYSVRMADYLLKQLENGNNP